jgi:hypothetical protein
MTQLQYHKYSTLKIRGKKITLYSSLQYSIVQYMEQTGEKCLHYTAYIVGNCLKR